jgi:transcriptional regulator with XRE-family HTH domain
MSQEDLFINGDLLRLRREARGWLLNDMATRACMSVKQIRQLEEGGMSAFYSVAVKATAAKKVGALLGISADEVLGQVAEVEELPVESTAEDLLTVSSSIEVTASPEVVAVEAAESPKHDVPSDEEPSVTSQPEQTKPKTSLWVIVGLFATALAVAAYMQPQDETVAEPAPPLQVLPSEAVDAASAADTSPSSVPASADSGPASSAQKPVSTVAVSTPVASAPASAASKAP